MGPSLNLLSKKCQKIVRHCHFKQLYFYLGFSVTGVFLQIVSKCDGNIIHSLQFILDSAVLYCTVNIVPLSFCLQTRSGAVSTWGSPRIPTRQDQKYRGPGKKTTFPYMFVLWKEYHYKIPIPPPPQSVCKVGKAPLHIRSNRPQFHTFCRQKNRQHNN